MGVDYLLRLRGPVGLAVSGDVYVAFVQEKEDDEEEWRRRGGVEVWRRRAGGD